MDAPQQPDQPLREAPDPPEHRDRPVTGAVERILDDQQHGKRLAEELAHLLGRG